jgi:2-oxoglutarate dehydrogenase E2 component (dihydrolipoamide succinyltransferase)
MPVDVRIPTLGESVTEGVIVRWIKGDGDAVRVDEPLLELETDKASVELPAERAGILRILTPQGTTVNVGDVVARIEEGTAAKTPAGPAQSAPPPAGPLPSAPPSPSAAAVPATSAVLSPAVRRLVEEHNLDPRGIKASGRGGRLTKSDVLAHLEESTHQAEPQADASPRPQDSGLSTQDSVRATTAVPGPPSGSSERVTATSSEEEERVPMTHLRQRIAERLVQAQHTAAILTTFNEIDMSAVMELRARHKARFAAAHGVSLGFMSFFARACVATLKEMPIVNAQIDAGDVVYKKHVHLGVAVGTERGLVVPVVHHADRLSFADIEKEIERLAGLARQNKLGIPDLSGGTFTISNGGVYGSLLSTPIVNPPQSAILGMHKIEKRPVVVNDAVVIRPMMYVAVSYDHRLIDGEQAVTFLVRVKEQLEDPTRMLFEI